MKTKKNLLAFAISALSIASVLGFSQASLAERYELEEIIVTAQKREQNLQDVPVSVSVVGGDFMDSVGIKSIQDLSYSVPSLRFEMNEQPSTALSLSIRGMQSSNLNAANESAVGIFVDGMFVSRGGIANGELLDIEQIEILKGPQGTLFGKNTQAGALTLRSTMPTNEFEGYAEINHGNFNQEAYKGVVNIPLIDDLLVARIAASSYEKDGYIDNIVLGTKVHNKDREAVKAQLLYTPTETFTARLIADYNTLDESCCVFTYGKATEPYDVNYKTYGAVTALSKDPESTSDDSGILLDLQWDLGFADLKSISGYRKHESQANTRGFNPWNPSQTPWESAESVKSRWEIGFDSSSISQEFNLSGFEDDIMSGLSWVAGLYYYQEDIDYSIGRIFEEGHAQGAFSGMPDHQALFPAESKTTADYDMSTKSMAAFGQVTLDVTEATALTAGLRYTTEDKSTEYTPEFFDFPMSGSVPAIVSGSYNNQHREQIGYNQSLTDNAYSGTLKLQHNFTEDLMAFVSYSRGFKTGSVQAVESTTPRYVVASDGCTYLGDAGVDTGLDSGGDDILRCSQPGSYVFEPEVTDQWELGIRSTWLDGRLTMNATYYDIEITDRQLSLYNATTNVVEAENGGSFYSDGVELDWVYLPASIDGLRLSGSVNYNHAIWGDDVEFPRYKGEREENAPLWTGNLSASYNTALTDSVELNAVVDSSFLGPQQARVEENGSDLSYNGDRFLVAANVGVTIQDDLELSLWCRNCTNEDKFDALAVIGILGKPAEPRTYGVRARYSF